MYTTCKYSIYVYLRRVQYNGTVDGRRQAHSWYFLLVTTARSALFISQTRRYTVYIHLIGLHAATGPDRTVRTTHQPWWTQSGILHRMFLLHHPRSMGQRKVLVHHVVKRRNVQRRPFFFFFLARNDDNQWCWETTRSSWQLPPRRCKHEWVHIFVTANGCHWLVKQWRLYVINQILALNS